MDTCTKKKQSTIFTKITLLFLAFFIILVISLGTILTNTAKNSYTTLSAQQIPVEKRITLKTEQNLIEQNKQNDAIKKLKEEFKNAQAFNETTTQAVAQVDTNITPSTIDDNNANNNTELQVISDEEFNRLTAGSACTACHNPKVRTVGPSFRAMTAEYKGKITKELINKLSKKAKIGSIAMQSQGYTGPWVAKGYPPAMSPNTTPNGSNLNKVILYILSYNK